MLKISCRMAVNKNFISLQLNQEDAIKKVNSR